MKSMAVSDGSFAATLAQICIFFCERPVPFRWQASVAGDQCASARAGARKRVEGQGNACRGKETRAGARQKGENLADGHCC